MAAKVSKLAQEVLAKAAELPAEERALVANAITQLPIRRGGDVADRHAVIAERIRRAHAGEAETLSLEEVEHELRTELDL